MKRIIAIILASMMLLALVACNPTISEETTTDAPANNEETTTEAGNNNETTEGGNNETTEGGNNETTEGGNNETTEDTDEEDIVVGGDIVVPNVPEEAWGYAFWEIFAESIQGNSDITTDEIVYNFMMNEAGQALGFCDNMNMPEGYLPGFSADITGFKSATVFTPMASGFAFMGYVFELENAEDVPAFMLTLNEYHDLRWMICMTAEAVTMGAYENYVLFIMSPVMMPGVGGADAEIVYPENAEDNTYAANIWNFFEEEMTFNPTASAEGIAYALGYSFAVPFEMSVVTAVDTAVENAHFANGFDCIESIYSITEEGSDVVIYVLSIEMGLMADGWGAWYITGEDVVWGAYNNMLIAIHNGNVAAE